MDEDFCYNKLFELKEKLKPYYKVDKIKSYCIYIYSEDFISDECDGNIFDLYPHGIHCIGNFTKNKIIPEALSILKEMQKYIIQQDDSKIDNLIKI